MDDEIGTYSFFPWLREGIANNLSDPVDPSAKRGQMLVNLSIDGQGVNGAADINATIDKRIELYGPGDIVGIDSKAIIKNEPRNWITNFEPNYLPYIDFADPDFLWRYTPEAADTDRLTPWLTLITLREDEFGDGKNILNRPLPYVSIDDGLNLADVLPPADFLWAWAHVHINKNIVGEADNPVSGDQNAFISQLKNALSQNPDLAYCRLLASRKLDENAAYHTFLIPTFEAGRLAGLGINPMPNPDFGAATVAWEGYASREESKNFPYYHRWYFRTSTVGDFEYLVRLLQPKVADSRVGHRDFDVLDPGSNISSIDDERLKGILRLGGALRFPIACLDEQQTADYNNYDQWVDTYPHDLQKDLAAFVNLADDYGRETTSDAHDGSDLAINELDGNPDPLVTPPYYGHWHAMMKRLLKAEDGSLLPNNRNWIHQLNLDPRWRTAANFGTDVVRANQEEYMDGAWGQVGDVLEANHKLNLGKLAELSSKVWYQRDIVPKQGVALERYLLRTMPLSKRVMTAGKTVYHSLDSSRLSHALVSAPMRRVTRRRGRLIKQLGFVGNVKPTNLIARVNDGKVSSAPARITPHGLVTHDDIADITRPDFVPGVIADLLARYSWLIYLPIVLAVIIIILLLIGGLMTGIFSAAIASVALAGVVLFLVLRKLSRDINSADRIRPEQQTPEQVDNLPSSPDFRITEFADNFVPSSGSVDSDEGIRFKTALRTNFSFVQRSAEVGALPSLKPIDIRAVVDDVIVELNPEATIPRYLFGQIEIPTHILDQLKERFPSIMAYPVIDLPMYEPLLATGTDNFVPNINLIEQNSITLLETNQEFIEAYMVGVNHEMIRECQWRSFPTDMMGTVFRQFWDVTSYINKDDLNDEQIRERLRDIPPIHRWPKRSELGDHDHRELQGDKEEEVVLVIRGELLKKYPTAVIYAHKAKWATDVNGDRDLKKPRELEDEGEPVTFFKTPLYEAKAEPDIYFFGFDLTVVEAKGDSGEEDDDDPGWFFVIKERPGEPRFGLDVPGQANDFAVAKIDRWNDLAWSHVVDNVTADKFLGFSADRTVEVDPPIGAQPADGQSRDAWQQKQEDSHLSWNDNINSAELAYILCQVPVLIGVHAAEMLPDACDNES